MMRMIKLVLWTLLTLLIIVNLHTRMVNVLGARDERSNDESKQTTTLERDYQYWQQIIREHPDYRDGYVQLAILSYRLGRSEESQTYVSRVRLLDPNYPGITNLEDLTMEK